ncbi:MAG: hypothetical protein H7068_05055 [Pedobacter sp.]|nr:hypothetical protein [Chitinophagaceae bacterium]
MKKTLLYLIAAVTVGAIGCRKIEEDGQTIYVNGGGSGGTSTQTITLKGRIDKDTVLRAGNNYILSGLVYMVNNATMKIEPGVTVKGDYQGANVAALIITRGAKLVADATQDNPIVFTSNSPVQRSGDWGGIVLCGKASVNASFTGTGGGTGIYEIEGGVNNTFGDGLAGGGATPNDDDSSGVLRYVRIEYAGYAFQPDKEINSLTMGAVGRKTVIDYVQVTYAKDDAFEWFGGTVNCKHLIAYKTQDDDFDTDNGFSGNIQFGIILRDSTIADISRSEGFESDNDANGSTAAPQTRAVFSNITAIGPRATLANSGSNLYLTAAQIRRNSAISIMNSVFIGWPQGLLIDSRNGRAVENNIIDSNMRFKNNSIIGCNPAAGGTDISSMAFITAATNTLLWNTDSVRNRYNGIFGNNILVSTGSNNGIPGTVNQVFIAPFNYAAPDFLPFAGSNGYAPVLTGASFTDPKLASSFFDKTLSAASGGGAITFRGACAPAGPEGNWWRGWTRFVNQ